jgi:hypothetical protein
MTSNAKPGYGSTLCYSLDQSHYTAVAQLQKFEPSGSKLTIVDQTTLRTGGNFTAPLAVQVDGGEIDFAGVYSSNDPTQAALGGFHGSMTLVYWRVILSDGSVWSFAAYVSEFKPWAAVYNKFIPFSGKLRLVGGMSAGAGCFSSTAFDTNAFDASGFLI